MKDNLEQFVDRNRDAFNQFEPSPDVWGAIEKSLDKAPAQKAGRWRRYLYRAAVVLAIFATSVFTVEFLHQQGIQLVKTEKIDGSGIPELREAENYYNARLQEKLDEAKPILMDNPELGSELNRDLNELDSIYNELKDDLKDKVATTEVVEALIQNYRLRIDILEDLLHQFDEDQNKEDNAGTERYENSI